ncbi:MAG: VWA domain-containing protein [Armatimonas sp.]
MRTLRWMLALWALWILGMSPTHAQDTDLGEAGDAVHAMQTTSPKNLLLVLDVSGSMRKDRMLARTREAIYTLLNEGAQKGDRVALFTFGSGYKKVFDETLQSESDKKSLFAQVPTQPENGAGTNIRKPHHEALKLAEGAEPKPSYIVLLTDSFNDEPKPEDPERVTYLKYYIPGGRLDKYPKTTENADYERLLLKYKDHTFGVGIGLDENGRPKERLPKDAPTPAPVVETTPPPIPNSEKPDGPPVAAIIGGLAVLALGAGAYFFLNPKPMPLRVALSSGGSPKDFQLKGNVGVRLGGEGAAASFDAYPLAGTKDPVGKLTGARGQLMLYPQPNAAARVFINGVPLDKPTVVRYGDEIRVSLTDKEIRLKLIDPAKSF